MKKMLALLLVALMILGTVPAAMADSEKITLTFWNGFTGPDGEILKEIVNRFNEENGKNIFIDMDIMAWDSFHEKLPTAIATSTAPDFVLMGSDNYGAYYSEGMLRPMDDFWSFEGVDKADFMPSVLDLFIKDGVTYGIPMQCFCKYLYWNKDLFAAAGLDPEAPPTTYDQLVDYAVKLTDPAKNVYGLAFPNDDGTLFNHMLMINGGNILSDDGTAAALNSEAGIKVMADIAKLVADDKVSPLGTAGSEFDSIMMTNTLAMYVNGPWLVNGLRNNAINFGVVIFPEGPAGHRGTVDANNYAIPVSTSEDKVPYIYEFVNYWNSTAICKEWSMRNGFPPYLYSVANDEEIKADSTVAEMSKAVEFSQPVMAGMTATSRINSDAINPMLEAVYNGADPATELKNAEDTINSLLKEG
jgi:multiple sugar transport system substrate-binding protein